MLPVCVSNIAERIRQTYAQRQKPNLLLSLVQCLNCGKRSGGSLTSERDAIGVKGEEYGRDISLPSRLGRLLERRKLPQWGLGLLPKLNLVYFSHKIWLLVAFLTKMMTVNGDRKV